MSCFAQRRKVYAKTQSYWKSTEEVSAGLDHSICNASMRGDRLDRRTLRNFVECRGFFLLLEPTRDSASRSLDPGGSVPCKDAGYVRLNVRTLNPTISQKPLGSQ